ncbi:MAG TPA: gamma-glutamyl-gamma-aminobutyrate hydrolase family protein [Candidatus Cybelea sp.]
MRPRIIVTASRGQNSAEYFAALREAGADPVQIEPGDPVERALDEAAGLLVTGGVDVDPAAYGAPASSQVTDVQAERDVLELEALRSARGRGMPTLCICRGLQIANVTFGGTLITHIPAILGDKSSIPHQPKGADGKTLRGLVDNHVVAIEPETLLADIVGTTTLVTGSRHHQAVLQATADLRVVARTGDGIVEAMEARFASPFWLAVQWHPESTVELDGGASRAVFRRFAVAAGRRG